MKTLLNITLKQICAFAAGAMMMSSAYANPELSGVAIGNATVTQTATTTQINQASQQAVIDWKSFNIGANESTHFEQPAGGVALNRIDAAQGASQIYGQLSATGRIILVNGAGFYFGPNAMVNVGGLIASTSGISVANFLAGKYIFDQPSNLNGSIVNDGTIRAAAYGLVAFMGASVTNNGLIQAELGSVVLGSGKKFTLDFTGDQLVNFAIDDSVAQGAANPGVKNTGTLLADGGKILVSARAAQGVIDDVINMSGVARAQSVDQRNGVIILSGGEQGTVDVSGIADVSGAAGGTIKVLGNNIHLASTANLNASGDLGGGTILVGGNYQGKGPEQNALNTTVDAGAVLNANALTSGNGGKIVVWSNGDTEFHGNASARGGLQSGDGGSIETSGHYLNVANAKIDLSSSFAKTGTWLLDPSNLTICTLCTTTNPISGYTYSAGAANSNLLVSDLTASLGSANIIVQTTNSGAASAGDILVNTSINWNSGNSLTLTAYHSITVAALTTISNSGTGAINLVADNTGTGSGTVSFGLTSSATSSGGVNIFYNPTTFGTPTSSFYSGGTTPTAYQLINSLGASTDTTTRSLASLSNNSALWGQNFALATNIDASATSTWNSGAGFLPIALGSSFTGNFNGNNNVISNLFINRPATNSVGLFSVIGAATTYKNLGIINANVTGNNSVGILHGDTSIANTMSISYVYTTGTVTGISNVGGLAGITRGFVSDSYSLANVTAAGSNIGGLFGAGNSGLNRVYAGGNVTATNTSGNVNAGGLGGQFQAGSGSAGSINDAYAYGNVTALTGTQNVGGFLGQIQLSGTVNKAYSTGLVTVPGGTTGVGGFLGINGGGTISNSFFDADTSGQGTKAANGTTSSGITAGCFSGTCTTGGVTTSLSSASTFSGATWSIASASSTTPNNSTWFIIPTSTRPMLMSEEFSSNTPLTINNAHQLQLMSASLNGNYTLGSNIDFSNVGVSDVWNSQFAATASGSGFMPIAVGSTVNVNPASPFTGSFNGQNYVINGLYINRPTLYYVGLFGYVHSGTANAIQNVGVTKANITGIGDVGGIAGALAGTGSNVIANNVYVSGLITSAGTGTLAGGITGFLVPLNNASFSGIIQNSYNAATVTSTGGTATLGGIAGGAAMGTITNSYNIGTISAPSGAAFIGGLIGDICSGCASNLTLTNSYNSGLVSASSGSVGALTGDVNDLAAGTNFFDNQTSGATFAYGTVPTSTAPGLSTAQMMQSSSFTTGGWSGTSGVAGSITATPSTTPNNFTWFIINGSTRPMLTTEEFSGNAPLTINSAHQLQLMNANPTGNYSLGSNIDFSNVGVSDVWNSKFSATTSGAGFSPIGTNTNIFTGSFNGNNNVINGLYISQNQTAASIGLFGNASGTIQNLGLVNENITGGATTGGLAGTASGTITNVYVTGSVTATSPAASALLLGGLIGNGTSSNVSQAYSAVNVTGTLTTSTNQVCEAGLICQSGTVNDSYSTGSVTEFGASSNGNSNVAGFIAEGGGPISTSYSTGLVSSVYNNAAGLAGFMAGSSPTITSDYWYKLASGQANGAVGAPSAQPTIISSSNVGSLFGGFSSSIWGVLPGSFPYLKGMNVNAPVFISGTTPVTGTGTANTINLAVNGTVIDKTTTADSTSNYYFFMMPQNTLVSAGNAFLVYTGTATDGNVVDVLPSTLTTAITGANIANTQQLTFGNANSSSTISNTNAQTARGSLTTDILFTGTTALNPTSGTSLGGITTASGGSIFTGNIGLTQNTSINVASGAQLTLSGVISNGFSLTTTGSGTLVLSGANTYSGGTSLNVGTINLGISSTGAITNGPLGTGTLTLNGGTLTANAGPFSIANPYTVATSST
ncbi:MAG: filamentous hemagglutinin N-terminal domain-containing protein, partial [Gammaproteobacteria bacterium]|nr:filamentous hemagglutinin N-terminal domain-containing protein [Gammaproteobacteria bacterium]